MPTKNHAQNAAGTDMGPRILSSVPHVYYKAEGKGCECYRSTIGAEVTVNSTTQAKVQTAPSNSAIQDPFISYSTGQRRQQHGPLALPPSPQQSSNGCPLIVDGNFISSRLGGGHPSRVLSRKTSTPIEGVECVMKRTWSHGALHASGVCRHGRPYRTSERRNGLWFYPPSRLHLLLPQWGPCARTMSTFDQNETDGYSNTADCPAG